MTTMQNTPAYVLRIRCPGCGEADLIGPESLGKRGKCRRCGLLFQIPAPARPAGNPSPFAVVPPPRNKAAILLVGACVGSAVLAVGGYAAYQHFSDREPDFETLAHMEVTTLASAPQPRSTNEVREAVEPEPRREPEPEARAVPPAVDAPAERFEAALASSDPVRIRELIHSLNQENWWTRESASRIGNKLSQVNDASAEYELVKMLKHMSQDSTGPLDLDNYLSDRAAWKKQWIDWAAAH